MRIGRNSSNVAKKLTIFLIILTALVAAGAVIFSNLYKDMYFANQKFEELSRNFYENYLYENFLNEHSGENLEAAIKNYTVEGFRVKLRQILNYEFVEHGTNYRSYFETETFSCNTNGSWATFYPRAPYGKKDYEPKFELSCEKS